MTRKGIENVYRFLLFVAALLLIFICMMLFSSCAWHKERTKDIYYGKTILLIEWNLPKDKAAECYDLEQDRPRTIAEGPGGRYDPVKKIAFFDELDGTYLIHEYQHHLNHNGPSGGKVEWACLDELTAYQARSINKLMSHNVRLEWEVSRLRRRIR